MRYLLIRLSENWTSYQVFDCDKDVPWTNNLTEQAIGRMKACPRKGMRSRTVRGYKSSGEVDFDISVILEGASGSPSSCDATAITFPVQIVNEIPSEMVVNIDAPGAGYLVITDLWYPGWKAWAGETEAPILHAGYLFQAVAVGSGKGQVTLR